MGHCFLLNVSGTSRGLGAEEMHRLYRVVHFEVCRVQACCWTAAAFALRGGT